uniref:Uncharacterized protein n=1 Tax=Nelumbo nucifera TaxID=4432 RepID=A0A822XS98_NELNU|nr:TPA_asm: hypothetical protein HUJ06_023158 [Nelumbo nucifera]
MNMVESILEHLGLKLSNIVHSPCNHNIPIDILHSLLVVVVTSSAFYLGLASNYSISLETH